MRRIRHYYIEDDGIYLHADDLEASLLAAAERMETMKDTNVAYIKAIRVAANAIGQHRDRALAVYQPA